MKEGQKLRWVAYCRNSPGDGLRPVAHFLTKKCAEKYVKRMNEVLSPWNATPLVVMEITEDTGESDDVV